MMFNVIKWLVASLIALFILIYAAILSAYYFGLRGLPDDTTPAKISYSVDMLRAEWIASGETGEIQMTPLSPVDYVIVGIKYLYYVPKIDARFNAPPGLRVATQGARLLLAHPKNKDERILYRYWREASTSIWITNHWTANEALNTLLDHSDFGLHQNGIELAAKEYFNKPPLQLNISEIAILFAIRKNPAINDPWCNGEKVINQANFLLERLSANWPQKYQKHDILKKMPEGLVSKKTECPSNTRDAK